MRTLIPRLSSIGRPRLASAAALVLVGACADEGPLTPAQQVPLAPRAALAPAAAGAARMAIARLRGATARYHDIDVAIDDGFVFLHPCEVRPGEGPIGVVYVHLDRLLDGVIDPGLPDALVYEPQPDGSLVLVAAELAIPYALWSAPEPPTFLGATFQREDEFGVFGLHAWVWRHNPEGMFAEANPRVSCEPV